MLVRLCHYTTEMPGGSLNIGMSKSKKSSPIIPRIEIPMIEELLLQMQYFINSGIMNSR